MDSYRIEKTNDCGYWYYEFYYETHDKETAEKIETFFKELMREKYGKTD